MANSKISRLRAEHFFYLMLMVGCMIPGYLLVPYGMYFADEPYQIMNTMDICRSPMAPLTSCMGGILGRLTDFRWIAFRYLAVTLNNLAVIVSGIYLYRRIKSLKITAVAVSVAIFLSGLSRDYQNIYGWDCWTSLFTPILIIFILELIDRPGSARLVAACAAAALTISFRIPNCAVVIPMGWLILFVTAMGRRREEKGMPKSYPWLYVLFTGIFLVLIIWVSYGSLKAYIDSLRNNMLSEHSASYLLTVLLFDIERDGFSILAYGMLAGILEEAGSYARTLRSFRCQKLVVLCVSLCAIGFISLMPVFNPTIVDVRWYDVDWILLALFFALWQYFRKGDREGLVISLTVLLIGCVGFVGSNMGIVKYPGYILIPFTTALLLPLCGIKKMKYYMLIAGVPLLVMNYFVVRNRSFMDCGLLKADTRVESGRAKGLYSDAGKVRIVESIEAFKKEADPEGMMIVAGEGHGRFVYEYLLDCTDSYHRHDWSWANLLESEENIEWLEKRLGSIDNPVVVYVHPGKATTKVKEFLDRTMRISAEYDGFTVYVMGREEPSGSK